jgi:hypothetical protein
MDVKIFIENCLKLKGLIYVLTFKRHRCISATINSCNYLCTQCVLKSLPSERSEHLQPRRLPLAAGKNRVYSAFPMVQVQKRCVGLCLSLMHATCQTIKEL